MESQQYDLDLYEVGIFEERLQEGYTETAEAHIKRDSERYFKEEIVRAFFHPKSKAISVYEREKIIGKENKDVNIDRVTLPVIYSKDKFEKFCEEKNIRFGKREDLQARHLSLHSEWSRFLSNFLTSNFRMN